MSIQLLNDINGKKSGEFKKLIESFSSQPRIAWYPSAGEDFRALLYLHNRFIETHPATVDEPKGPDLFIFTDYFPWQNSTFLDNRTIHADSRTLVSIEHIEELPKQNYPLNRNLVDFPEGSTATNRVVFLKIKINSNELGVIRFPVLYVFMENTTFFCQKLAPNNAVISHIIHIRYGGGCGGGGTATGIWLKNVTQVLQTEIFLTDGHDHWQRGDYFALDYCPKIPRDVHVILKNIRTINSSGWSGHGDVSWNLIVH
jgi:hypothetical protein